LHKSSSFSKSTENPARIKLHFDEKYPGLSHMLLDHPSRRNALTAPMMLDLVDHLKTLSCWKDGRAVVIRGSGHNFCAGADLKFASLINTPEEGLIMHDLMATALDELRDLPILSVAAIEGAAVGGGAELMTACDWRIFAHNSKVQFVQTSMGISPGWGGARRLVDIVGRQEALKLLALGTPIQVMEVGAKLLSIGLADKIVGDCSQNEDDIVTAAVDFLSPALNTPSANAVRAVKSAVVGASPSHRYQGGEGYGMERDAFSSVWAGEDNKRAVKAVLDAAAAKRK
jgi:ethylmalonyl-CoA/methylmalonyl-CoA decarboxylase